MRWVGRERAKVGGLGALFGWFGLERAHWLVVWKSARVGYVVGVWLVVVGACVGWKCGRWVIWLAGVIFMLEA